MKSLVLIILLTMVIGTVLSCDNGAEPSAAPSIESSASTKSPHSIVPPTVGSEFEVARLGVNKFLDYQLVFDQLEISGNIVVWADNRDGDYGIYARDLVLDSEVLVSEIPSNYVGGIDVSGNNIVWADDNGIHLHDVKTNEERIVGDGILPSIDGNTAVWTVVDFFEPQGIEGYEISEEYNESFGIPGPTICETPSISGNVVVWTDYREVEYIPASYMTPDIYGYNLATGDEFPVCTGTGEQSSPNISGNIIVWLDRRHDKIKPNPSSKEPIRIFDIYGYDLESQIEFPICTHDERKDHLSIHGDIIVWTDYRNTESAGLYNGDIYGYDLSTGVEFPVCLNESGQMYPAVSGNTIVWMDTRNQVPEEHHISGTNDFYWDIYGVSLSRE